jgi:hypothetical protein
MLLQVSPVSKKIISMLPHPQIQRVSGHRLIDGLRSPSNKPAEAHILIKGAEVEPILVLSVPLSVSASFKYVANALS